ncbi:Ku protein, partial [Pseudomonas syringae]|nr:Ku protein [Pseudomonas syringae]
LLRRSLAGKSSTGKPRASKPAAKAGDKSAAKDESKPKRPAARKKTGKAS